MMIILVDNPIKYGAFLHCFGGDKNLMDKYKAVCIYYFGIGGRISHMIQELNDAVIDMSTSRVLLETDSPYVRYEGEKMHNTSLALYDIAQSVALLKRMTVNQVVDVTMENFHRLFTRT